VLWQHVFQVVVCVLSAVQRQFVVCVLSAVQSHAARHSVHTPQPETHAATTLHYL